MTHRERMEKTYNDIRKKHPEVTDKDAIAEIAIKHDKKLSLLGVFGWFAGALAFAGICLFLDADTFSETRGTSFIAAIAFFFEGCRAIGRYTRIRERYKPVLRVTKGRTLTRAQIERDGKSALKESGGNFRLVKLVLHDKEDSYDDFSPGIWFFHRFYLHFNYGGKLLKCRVKRNAYNSAVVGTDFYVAITSRNCAVTAYTAYGLSFSPELLSLIE